MESRKQRKLSDDTVFTHNYMFVITSLPSEISVDQILSCYRLRWKVELVFKRLKPLLGLGSIPTKTKEAGETWINGKILLSLLTEKYLGDIDFPPPRLSENSFFKFSGHIILLLFILFITIFCGLDYPIFSFRTVSPRLQLKNIQDCQP